MTIQCSEGIPRWFYWAYRYSSNNEPAILVCSKWDYESHWVAYTVGETRELGGNLIRRSWMPFEEWQMWQAFELCPVIELYPHDEDSPRCTGNDAPAWRYMKLDMVRTL